MTADREVANAVSDGLNALHALARGGAAEPAALQALEQALEAVRSKRVTTSWAVNEADIDTLRRLRALAAAGRDADAAALAGPLYDALSRADPH